MASARCSRCLQSSVQGFAPGPRSRACYAPFRPPITAFDSFILPYIPTSNLDNRLDGSSAFLIHLPCWIPVVMNYNTYLCAKLAIRLSYRIGSYECFEKIVYRHPFHADMSDQSTHQPQHYPRPCYLLRSASSISTTSQMKQAGSLAIEGRGE